MILIVDYQASNLNSIINILDKLEISDQEYSNILKMKNRNFRDYKTYYTYFLHYLHPN